MPSRVVCFVCGSLGGEYAALHSLARDGGAYFPFLEHHDPPKGSRIPVADGMVDSCRVCFAFLTQQWETYERSNTPAVKRLYWLKRLDDGQFTGAEMKLQGEYMAQVMGLQYQPACGDNCAPLSPDESTASYSREGFATTAVTGRDRKAQDFNSSDFVLDLSVPIKAEPAPKKVEKRKPISEEEKPARKSAQRSKPSIDEYSFVCYTCGSDSQGVAAKFIRSVKHADNDHFYPFLSKITPPRGALPISSQGVCQVCEHCHASLQHQWLSYEHHGTPNSARIFKVNGFFFSNDSSIAMAASDEAQGSSTEVCYLCSQACHQAKLCPLLTSCPSGGRDDQIYFPFIRELRRPNGARPLNPDGSVRVCVNCFGNLHIQWKQYEAERIPVMMRRYSLLPPNVSAPQTLPNKNKSEALLSMLTTERGTKSPMQPLNVDVNENPEPPTNKILPPVSSAQAATTASTFSWEAGSQQNTSANSNSNEGKTGSAQSIPHPLLQAGERPKKVCFICGEKCLVSKTHLLFSYPAKQEVKTPGGQPQAMPFFPFLANREPAPQAEPMTEEGTVTSCAYCFYSLLNQWRAYEESLSAQDKNCWLRKYATNEFVCFVCGLTVKRRKMRTLEVNKFQFLREHKAPHEALVMWAGEGVGACGSCHFSLTHQYAEYERLGVPLELRKYNWTVQNPVHTNDNSCDGPDTGQGQPSSGNEDSNLSMDDALGHASKPPFSLINSTSVTTAMGTTSSKLPLKTATVPPLSQVVSPSSTSRHAVGPLTPNPANQTSSFAAALRKLAHQAKEPDESVLKSTHSPPTAHSPRSTTPKRSSLPLAFSSHSLPSSLPAPPVVTIAPTPAHHHHQPHIRTDSRQTLPHDAGRTERDRDRLDHHPHTSLSREEERGRSKESPHTRTPIRPYPQVSSASSSSNGLPPTSQALDLYAGGMGFSPYRSLEEEAAVRHGLPLPYGIDPSAYAAAAAAAAYHPALLQQHPAFLGSPFRLDDPLLLERYRLLQSPYLSFPMGPGLMPSHPSAGGLGVHSLLASAAVGGQGYPAELLHQHFPYLSGGHALMDPRLAAQAALLERSRLEEDKAREKEREREREADQEKRDNDLERARAASRLEEREREREASLGQSERSRADILNIPSRAVQPLERDQAAHRYHGDERSRLTGSPTSKYKTGAYQAGPPNLRPDHPSAVTSSSSVYASHASHLSHNHNHSHGKPPSHHHHPPSLYSDKPSSVHPHPHTSHGSHHTHQLVRPTAHQTSHGPTTNSTATAAVSHNKVRHSSDTLSPPSKPSSFSSSSDSHGERKARHTTEPSSRIFRPFDEPKPSAPSPSSTVEREDEGESSRRLCEPSAYHLPPSLRPVGRSAGLEGTSSSTSSSSSSSSHSHHHYHFPSNSAPHDTTTTSKSCDLLTIPVLRVQPQIHSSSPSNNNIGSSSSSRSLFSKSSHLEDGKETRAAILSSSSSSSSSQSVRLSKPLSHCISDRIQRFDFKSLARECTNAPSSTSPAPLTQGSAEVVVMEPQPTSLSLTSSSLASADQCVMSKLDREESLDLGATSGQEDAVDFEERMTAHLTMVGRTTPIPLHTPKDKLSMFSAVGLTTRGRKKEMLLKREARRRAKQGLSCASPALHVVDQTQEFQAQGTASRDQLYQRMLLDYRLIDPALLNHQPDAQEKADFLGMLGLKPSSPSHRAECNSFLKRKYAEMMDPNCAFKSTAFHGNDTAHPIPVLGHRVEKRQRSQSPPSSQPSQPPQISSSSQQGNHQQDHPPTLVDSALSEAKPSFQPSHSVIFSNVDSWLRDSSKGLDKDHLRSSDTTTAIRSSTVNSSEVEDRRHAPFPTSAIPFPYNRDVPRLDDSDPRLVPAIPAVPPVPWSRDASRSEAPAFWPAMSPASADAYFLLARNAHKEAMEKASSHKNETSYLHGSRSGQTHNPFTQSFTTKSDDGRQRLNGEEQNRESSMKNLKGFQPFR